MIIYSNRNSGFTLVELAIALMVIGLLIGGVLKGQELIENARITATIRQLKAYDAATLIFRNTYNALPGDIKRPNRIPNCTTDICNIGGNGNGKLSGISDPQEEGYNFFPHLTKAGLIQGPEGGTTDDMSGFDLTMAEMSIFFPQTSIDPFGSDYLNFIQIYDSSSVTDNMEVSRYVITSLSGKNAAAIDMKTDDGNPITGSVIVNDNDFGYSPVNCRTDEEYNIQEACSIYIRTGF